MRPKRRLKGEDKIALKVRKILNRFKMAKHFLFEISPEAFRYCRNHEGIAEEAALDGIYVIRTSVLEESLSAPETVLAYKGLSRAERAFQTLKTVDLNVRPIFHWTPQRVRGHVFVCTLAYYGEWHM